MYQIDRGVTQTLIERGFQAAFLVHGSTDKPPSFVINVLRDQEDALEGIFDFISQRRPLSTSYIKELHAALVRSQDHTEAQDSSGNLVEIPLPKGAWKTQPNYPIRNGVIHAYCPPELVASEMDRLVALHLEHVAAGVAADVEAAWLHHRFSQIHPFQDCNGRVCRALASMVLVRAGLFPLVVTRDDKNKYLDALEAADNGNLRALVDLFAAFQRAQFRKATALSENLLSEGNDDVTSILDGLLQFAAQSHDTKAQNLKSVFRHSEALADATQLYLQTLVPSLQRVMLNFSAQGTVFVHSSSPDTNHYYWGQIIENARKLNYFADGYSYRSWITLNLRWHRQARLVFAFHGIGRPFSGSLICAPFLEFRDPDESSGYSTIVPVSEEGFIFFYNQPLEQTKQHFAAWREKVVAVALKEIGESLRN